MGSSTLPTPDYRYQSTIRTKDSRSRVSLAEAVGAFEKHLIQEALKKTGGNRVQAAKLLDSTGRIITYKVKKYNIDCRQFRQDRKPTVLHGDDASSS
ncbi:MAG: helix-turn-helix domain-containing protein [Vicinamibacterales bacterium]|jgi:Nif-specific regulatory protein|nr:helix-turn-helix domain-containing protein [Vicinamibacterales bacterium]